MDRTEMKEILKRIVDKMSEEEAPLTGCIFDDNPCDVTTFYAVGEEG